MSVKWNLAAELCRGQEVNEEWMQRKKAEDLALRRQISGAALCLLFVVCFLGADSEPGMKWR